MIEFLIALHSNIKLTLLLNNFRKEEIKNWKMFMKSNTEVCML